MQQDYGILDNCNSIKPFPCILPIIIDYNERTTTKWK